jgi:hypothetical protein
MLKVDEKTNDKNEECDPVTRTSITIDVTPRFRQKNMVVCYVDPPVNYTKGGSIRLPQGHYTLEFRLLDGTPANLNFAPDKSGACQAFWSDADDCPTHEMNDPQYQPRLIDSRTVSVDVDTNGQNAIHYRLNFDNNCNFDPIIIHE